MPHFTIEYSGNLDRHVDMSAVVELVRKAAVEHLKWAIRCTRKVTSSREIGDKQKRINYTIAVVAEQCYWFIRLKFFTFNSNISIENF